MALLCSLEWCVQAIAEESNQIDLLGGIALSVHSFLRTGRRFAVDEAREARGVLAIARGVVQIERGPQCRVVARRLHVMRYFVQLAGGLH
jgi:hypothetical protein